MISLELSFLELAGCLSRAFLNPFGIFLRFEVVCVSSTFWSWSEEEEEEVGETITENA